MKRTIFLTAISLVIIVSLLQLLYSCGGLSLTFPDRNNPYDPNATDDETPSIVIAPSNLLATGEFRSIILNWTDNSSDETGFIIERTSGTDGIWSEAATTDADAESWSDSGLEIEQSYTYRIKAVRTAESSEYSTEASATTLPLWQKVTIDDANSESSYWETSIALTNDNQIFVNYRKSNRITSSWLNTYSDFSDSTAWNGKAAIANTVSGTYTDLKAYPPDNIVTIYNKQSTNSYGDYYDLLYKEFDGTQWTNAYTVDNGNYDSVYGAFNSGMNCVFSKNTTETYISTHYIYRYYNAGMDWYNRLEKTKKSGDDLWNIASTINSDVFSEDAHISTASYGAITWTFWEDNGELSASDETTSLSIDGPSAAQKGIAAAGTSDGNIHVIYSYYDSGELKNELRYKYFAYDETFTATAGSSYSNSGSTGFYPALIADSNNRLHSVFQDYTLGTLVYRYKPQGGDWVSETLGLNGTFPDIALDNNNLPVISYYDIDAGKVCAARRFE